MDCQLCLKTIVACRAQGADGNAAVIAAQVCAERGLGAMPCLGGGADAAPACADDPAWSMGHVGCESYAAGTPRSFHEFCAEDADHDGRTAAAACPLACGTCPADDGPAARLDRAHDHACQLGQLLAGGGSGAASHGRCRHVHAPLCVSLGILPAKQTGRL